MGIKRTLFAVAIALAAVCPMIGNGAAASGRAPVVTSIAPDSALCTNDPQVNEDVEITGICFRGDIVRVFLSKSPDGSGSDNIELDPTKIVNLQSNIITAQIPLAQLTPNTKYYVFLVRGDGIVSTKYPNAFRQDVIFICTNPPTTTGKTVTLTSCKVVRVAGGKFVLQVNGTNFTRNDTIVLLNNTPCRNNKYPERFVDPSSGKTTRINCSGGLKQLLPATVQTRDTDGTLSQNTLTCDFTN